MERRPMPFWIPLLGLAWVLGLWGAVAGLPFFSESYNHLSVGDGMRGWWSAFDPERVPLRPFQHLAFYLLARCEAPSPGLARLPAFLLHAGSACLVAQLARRLGSGRWGAAAAGGLFLLAPNVKNLVWVAAISAPGRVFFLLAALVLLGRPRGGAGGRWLGALGVLSFLAALAFHQSAVVAVPLLVLLAWTPAAGRPARAREVLARPAVLSVLVLCAVYVLFLASLTERGNQLRDPEALPANVVKGLFALAPEGLRLLAVEGFRGHLAGAAGAVAAGGLTLLLAGAAGWILARGGPVGRFTVAAIAIDAVLPVLVSGYDQRYAYLSTAFAAAGCGVWVEHQLRRGAPRVALAPVALLGLAWGSDLVRDTAEYRQAGGVVSALLDQAAEERLRAGPGRAIALVDLPDVWGRERDLPVFNWGFPQAVERRGIAGPWMLLRTRGFHTSTDSRPVGPQELEGLAQSLGDRLLTFDPRARRLVPWDRALGE